MNRESRLGEATVHELVRLAVKKHSAAFWTHLGAVIPDYMSRRRRLREIGPFLSL